MGEDIAISIQNVSKCFKRYDRPVDRLKELLLPGKSQAREFWALRDINLEVPKGQILGIVGRNGSGKSTLLQILAGTLTPTTGEVRVNGRISALLELGSGFNPEFTGRQNVFFNGRLLGLSHREIEDKFDEIAGFADIGDFIDQPVKTYSSGMFIRLAFAVAVNVEPEILIVDEALAVGDVVFQHRCLRRMRSLMDSGVTTLFVSHDSGAVKTLCSQAIMLHDGRLQASGSPNSVLVQYMKLLTELELGIKSLDAADALVKDAPLHNAQQPTQKSESWARNSEGTCSEVPPERNVPFPRIEKDWGANSVRPKEVRGRAGASSGSRFEQAQAQFQSKSRRGNRKAIINKLTLLNQLGEYAGETPIFGFNEKVTLLVELKVFEPLPECIIGFYICDKNGNELIGSNTLEENCPIGRLAPGDQLQIQFQFQLPLRPGSYSLTVAGSETYSAVTFDWIDNALVFQVLPPDTGKNIHALVDLPISVKAFQLPLHQLSTEQTLQV